jgi:hypothetical protein
LIGSELKDDKYRLLKKVIKIAQATDEKIDEIESNTSQTFPEVELGAAEASRR